MFTESSCHQDHCKNRRQKPKYDFLVTLLCFVRERGGNELSVGDRNTEGSGPARLWGIEVAGTSSFPPICIDFCCVNL